MYHDPTRTIESKVTEQPSADGDLGLLDPIMTNYYLQNQHLLDEKIQNY